MNVRQVLLPVVVTDKDGHHITGLRQADFKVFEDGVEQKITAFTSEQVDISAPAIPVVAASQPETAVPAAPPKPLPARRTYVICLDMMHTAFSHFVQVREALRNLFREEQPGDSE
jgi:VWFA-related protein